MERPFAYDIPAIELLATRPSVGGQLIHGIYVYWFVSGDKITAEEGSRLWSQWQSGPAKRSDRALGLHQLLYYLRCRGGIGYLSRAVEFYQVVRA